MSSSSNSVYSGRFEEMSALLSSQEMYADNGYSRSVMKKILTLMSCGHDISVLSPQILKLLAHPDLLVKKVCCHFITEYSVSKSDLMILGISRLQTDTSDSNPMLRALALRTLCSIQNEAFLEYCMKPLKKSFKDRSAYVRRVAVNCCLRIHKTSSSAILEEGIVDDLYRALRDSDPVVVSNALSTLEEILSTEGGIVVSQSLAYHLLNFLSSLTDWGLITAFRILSKYSPKKEEEMFDIMNITDEYLKHSNLAVCTSCLGFFNHLVKDVPEVKLEVVTRSRDTLLNALSSAHSETTYTVLCLIESLVPEHKSAFVGHLQAFLCRNSEPTFVKVKRLQLIAELASDEDLEVVVDELALHCINSSSEVACVAVTKLGDVAFRSSQFLSMCAVKLKDLAEMAVDQSLSNIVQVVERLTEVDKTEMIPVVELITSKHQYLIDQKGKSSFVRLLSLYKSEIPVNVYVLEDIIESWLPDAGPELKRSLLTATIKMFFLCPGFCQEILGQILESCINDGDQDLSDSAVLYYKLLQLDPHKAKQIVEDKL